MKALSTSCTGLLMEASICQMQRAAHVFMEYVQNDPRAAIYWIRANVHLLADRKIFVLPNSPGLNRPPPACQSSWMTSRLLPVDQPEFRVMAHVKLVVEVLRQNKKVRAEPVRM